MRITWRTWAAPLAAALVFVTTTSANAAPRGDEACFKQAFQKRTAAGTWLVRECEDEKGLRYRVGFRAAQAKAQVQTLIDMHQPEGGTVGVEYDLVGGETLLIDAYAERGGRAYLVHPASGGTALSVAEFDYMSDDEEKWDVRQDGKRIVARTRHGTHVFTIDAQGALQRVPASQPKPKKGGQGRPAV